MNRDRACLRDGRFGTTHWISCFQTGWSSQSLHGGACGIRLVGQPIRRKPWAGFWPQIARRRRWSLVSGGFLFIFCPGLAGGSSLVLRRWEAVDGSTGDLRLLQTGCLRGRCHRARRDHCRPLRSRLVQWSLLSIRHLLRLLCPHWRDLRSPICRRRLSLLRGPSCKSIISQRICESLRKVLVL